MIQNKNNPIISTRGLYLSYDNKTPVISNCSFDIYKKDIVIITGVSGSGKSTLIKSLYGDIKTSKGSLFVNNFNMSNISKNNLMKCRQELGIIFQDYKLINEWTVAQNLDLPLKLKNINSHRRILQINNLLSHVKLDLKKDKYPLQLSGGEQQRVAVARAIGHNPKIIIADEPTGNLDDYSSEVIWGLLQGANQQLDITLIVVTHRIPQNISSSFRHFHLENGVLYDNA
jgi:cell division transport system ATP-binding protein